MELDERFDVAEHPQEQLDGYYRTRPPEVEPPADTYKLTQKERELVAQAFDLEVSLKLRVYELQTQLEATQRDLIGAAGQKRGILTLLTQSQGWTNAELSQDLTVLKRRGDGLDIPK